MRVLVTVSPLMYREAIALSLHQNRPDLEVRIAPPEAAEEQVRDFEPHLLVHNDTDGLDPEVLRGVPFWVEMCYSDSMDAKIGVDGRVEEAQDISTERLLKVADEAAAMADGA
ncbi:MAG TPA: hypothetical protein VHF70_00495 [Rubrobacteraceae bacterium]|nr:hypothetical protein [Rubrobacteraceae bacterium]